jgi:hypothetical protein
MAAALMDISSDSANLEKRAELLLKVTGFSDGEVEEMLAEALPSQSGDVSQ